jgi:hypothetical protein
MDDGRIADGTDGPRVGPARSRVALAAKVTTLAWLCVLGAGFALGGVASTYTGKASELPKWNGLDYFLFCGKEFAMLAGAISLPFAVMFFIFLWWAL